MALNIEDGERGRGKKKRERERERVRERILQRESTAVSDNDKQ